MKSLYIVKRINETTYEVYPLPQYLDPIFYGLLILFVFLIISAVYLVHREQKIKKERIAELQRLNNILERLEKRFKEDDDQ